MANKSLKELSLLLKNRKKELEELIEYFEKDTNPQVVLLSVQCKSELNLIESILYYADTGSKIYL